MATSTALADRVAISAGPAEWALAAAVWAVLTAPALAQAPVLVKDIVAIGAPSKPRDFTGAAGVVYFTADDGAHGRELWKTDGTEAGTVLVRDICAGTCSSAPAELTAVDDTVFFVADDGVAGTELWKSDGTTDGTVLVRDLWADSWYPPPGPSRLTSVGGSVFFVAYADGVGESLWRSDGTSSGTALVKDIHPGSCTFPRAGSCYSDLTAVGSRLFFFAADSSSGWEMWRSDGSAAGTVMVRDICPGTCSGSVLLPVGEMAGTVFFAADDGVHGTELWRSDGTAAGTTLVKDIRAGGSSGPFRFCEVAGLMFFVADDGVRGAELWRSDGTPSGTTLVTDIAPGSASSAPQDLANVDGRLYFAACDGVHCGLLWTSDGTAAGTKAVPGVRVSGAPIVGRDGVAFFEGSDGWTTAELWRSDGTPGGTVLVKDIRPGNPYSEIEFLTLVGDTLYFAASDGASGVEVWRSDGTTPGTWRVKDINPGGAGPEGLGRLTNASGRLFFTAGAGDPGAYDYPTGVELWTSDGTAAGTRLVQDIVPYEASSSPSGLKGIGRDVYFFTKDPSMWGRFSVKRSDGTSVFGLYGSEVDFEDNPPCCIGRWGSGATFLAGDGISGPYAFKTDGTRDGTATFLGFENRSVVGIRNVGGTLFLGVQDWGDLSPGPSALWRSDGTRAGSVVLLSGMSGPPGFMTDVRGRLFFVNGGELWTSDGAPAGTVLVKDIRPGEGQSSPFYPVDVDGTVYFTADDGVHGRELWRSDGTAGGTALVADVRPGPAGSEVPSVNSRPTPVAGRVFFTADDGAHGAELWVSDGTGTRLVADVRPGAVGSVPQGLTDVDGLVYFAADDGSTGVELWRSDGTSAGTWRVADLRPGPGGSAPSDLTNVNGTLYFVADDVVHGRELWKLPGQPSVPQLNWAAPLVAGGAATIAGRNLTPGAVVKVFVATAAGTVGLGPYVPVSGTSNALGLALPADLPLGNGFAAVQVINADAGYGVSNVMPALLLGSAAAGIPSITHVNGVALAPAALSIGLAHIDTVAAQGASVTIGGTGFADPVVSVFTATGKVDLVPTTWTATSVSVVLPATLPTGPGTFRVVNRPSYRESNAVASAIGAVPTISSVRVAGGVVTVTGTGFCALTVINLFNVQGGGVVNLGGLGPGGAAKVPLTLVSDTQFRFARPAGAVAGPAFVEVLNPPFIPYASSRSDPDGAFTMLAAAPLWTEHSSARPVPEPQGSTGEDDAGEDTEGEPGAAVSRELVTWTRAVGAHAAGDLLTTSPRWAAVSTTSPRRAVLSGRPGAGARSTRALLAGDGAVSWTVRADAGDVAFGFGESDRDGSLADLAFAWRLDPATRELQVYERGARQAAVGTHAPGDRLQIAVRAGVVEYRRNGALVFTSKAAPTYPLVVDASLGSPGATLQGVRLTGRLGTLIEWAAAPGVTTSSMAVASDADRAGTGPYAAGRGCDPAMGCAVAADLRGAAGIGFGATGCDYCIVRVDDRTVQVQHAGAVRGTWPAPVGTRVRVEVAGDALVRYWAGETLLDQLGKGDSFLLSEKESVPISPVGWLGARGGAITGGTMREVGESPRR
jgi:ELWxxDGT repeat protein